jgi:hypothetical protein
MKYWLLATVAATALVLPAFASEATFERTLQVNGRVELSVNTGSGYVHITRGSGTQVHVFARVKSTWGNSERRVKDIAANPPIDQTGNIIRIGRRHEMLNHVSIDYEIQAPENAFLDVSTGSGSINDEGVGENAKFSTGSGDIHATGLKNGYTADTGSGSIYIEQTGSGDVKAQTGSGDVELHGVNGGLHAGTGSGDIKVTGSPANAWKLDTGSGNVEFWPGSTGFALDASTGSGDIHTDREMVSQGTFNRHHVVGKIGGGGPTVRIQTGSGDIRIH